MSIIPSNIKISRLDKDDEALVSWNRSYIVANEKNRYAKSYSLRFDTVSSLDSAYNPDYACSLDSKGFKLSPIISSKIEVGRILFVGVASNFVQNYSFENGSGNSFDNWNITTTLDGTVTEDILDAFQGSRCVKLASGGTGTAIIESDGIWVDNQESYYLTIMLRELSGTSQVNLKVREYKEDEITQTQVQTLLNGQAVNGNWTRYVYNLSPLNADTKKVKIQVSQLSSSGEVLVDMVHFGSVFSSDNVVVFREIPVSYPDEPFGQGIHYPFQFEGDGGVRISKNNTLEFIHLKEDVKQLLFTGYGERMMRPSWGANLRRFVFEEVSSDLMPIIKNTVSKAFKYESRIQLGDIQIKQESSKLFVEVVFVGVGRIVTSQYEVKRNG